MEAYKPGEIIGEGTFGKVRKVTRISDGEVRKCVYMLS